MAYLNQSKEDVDGPGDVETVDVEATVVVSVEMVAAAVVEAWTGAGTTMATGNQASISATVRVIVVELVVVVVVDVGGKVESCTPPNTADRFRSGPLSAGAPAGSSRSSGPKFGPGAAWPGRFIATTEAAPALAEAAGLLDGCGAVGQLTTAAGVTSGKVAAVTAGALGEDTFASAVAVSWINPTLPFRREAAWARTGSSPSMNLLTVGAMNQPIIASMVPVPITLVLESRFGLNPVAGV